MKTKYTYTTWILLNSVFPSFSDNIQLLQWQSVPINIGTSWDPGSVCFQHEFCPDGYFCAESGLLGGWLRYGQCVPCASCSCDYVSMDGACPLSRCPSGPISVIKALQGSFYNIQSVIGSYICYTMFSFEGLTFRQMSFLLSEDAYASLVENGLELSPPDQIASMTIEQSHCSVIHGGLKGGAFEISPQNSITLRYTDGYSFVRNATVVLAGNLSDSCPDVRLTLDRSIIPRFIRMDAYWQACSRPVAMNPWNE